MSKSNTFEGEILDLIFLNINIPNIGDATGLRGSTAAGNIFASFHTADPGEVGTAATNELAYTGYARQPIPRGAGGFSRSGNVISQVNNVDFPKMTAGAGGTVTHFAYVKESSGASVILYKGPVTPSILVQNGVTPRLEGLPAGTSTTVAED
ncbi:MAG: phage tail fiber protein [Solimonas sp.]